ncbi:MAG: protein kinase [Ktedonobacteraceae bacterium]
MNTAPGNLGKYELVEQLGRGGLAEVWKAHDPQLQRYVAIKLLHPNLRDDPSFINRFEHEARLIASLHHPNIVQIHDFQVARAVGSDGRDANPMAYMVMDYVEGITLADYIHNTANKGLFPSSKTLLGLFTSISLAIDYAHQQGMIHRDIKPANILLDRRNTTRNAIGEPTLTDFGFAKLMGTSLNTLSGAQSGTPLYMSPEQAGGYPGNERSDLYSLGIILYEVTTGVLPFQGGTVSDVIAQHINAAPVAPSLINPDISPALSLVILRSIAKDPAARFPSAAAMTSALAGALNLAVPENLRRSVLPVDPEDLPTYISAVPSSRPSLAPTSMPHSTPGMPPVIATSAPAMSGGQTPTNMANQPGSTPILTQPQGQGYTSAPATQTPPASMPVSSPSTQTRPRNRWRYIALALLLLAVLLGSTVGAYFVFFRHTPTPVAASPVVGHAFFVSSGQLNPGSSAGIADQIQIDLQNIPAHQPGKAYYAWLLGDRNPVVSADLLGPAPIQPPVLLTNNLLVQNGRVHYLYPGDRLHDNLLSAGSRLLITEEGAGRTSRAPSADRGTWRYYAELPQAPIPLDAHHFSALIHIRHLFYNEEGVKVLGLPGGLDIWLFRNTEAILEWSISARDDWNGQNTSAASMQLIRDQCIRVLDYLDGSANVHLDVPSGTGLRADARISQVALLTVDPTQQAGSNVAVDPPGYIDHTELHVGQVVKATDITPEMRQLARRILTALKNAGQWLTNVRRDAKLLLGMDTTQFLSPLAGKTLDDLLTQATYAYIGQLDPSTNQVRPGVLQTHYDIQQLATFTITTQVPQHL